METRLEQKRARLFKIIAWSLSLALHIALLYVILGWNHTTNEAVVDQTASIVADH